MRKKPGFNYKVCTFIACVKCFLSQVYAEGPARPTGGAVVVARLAFSNLGKMIYIGIYNNVLIRRV